MSPLSLSRPPHHILAPSLPTLTALSTALHSLNLSTKPSSSTTITSASTRTSLFTPQKRHASHQAQGRANGARDGPGKRLGAKKTAGQYVVPGNILYRQRGTLWFPGEGCSMGRDHTIHAATPGYVTYYRDPTLHPRRKYIGIVFDRTHHLPQPPNAARRRQLGMLAYRLPSTTTETLEEGDTTTLTSAALAPDSTTTIDANASAGELPPLHHTSQQPSRKTTAVIKSIREGKVVETKLTLRPGYQWRQANYEIGEAGLRSEKATSVRPFRPGDRWAAWRKKTARVARNAERRALGRGGKKKK